ncbi:MAG: DUF6573 family protein [Candidatus Nitrospinota bacterium M3_3B_026]
MSEKYPGEFFGGVIHSYTRAQAIADGVLVDVTEMAKEAGFRWPVAITRTAWEDCVAWSEEDCERQVHQDESGRTWDVLYMAIHAMRLAVSNARRGVPQDPSLLFYELDRVPRDGKSVRPRKARLKLVAGPGDNGEPVITIMLPNED